MKIGIKEFKSDLKAGKIGSLYIFCGDEGYLREYYLSELEKNVVGDMMPEFNLTVINKSPEIDELVNVVESYPAMNDRRLIIVRDFDVIGAGAAFSQKAEQLFADMPEYSVLVFVYANIKYEPDKRRKLYKVFEKYGTVVEFEKASHTDLISWVKRRFLANGKDISNDTADYMIFYSGELMEKLIPEIEKVSAFSKKKEITRADIDAVASRDISSSGFKLADAVVAKKYSEAFEILEALEAQNENPISVLAPISYQFRRLYAAKLVSERGGGAAELVSIAPGLNERWARNILTSARSVDKKRIKKAIELAAKADARLKRGGGWEELSQLVANIAAEDR